MSRNLRYIAAFLCAVAISRLGAEISHHCKQDLMRYFANASREYDLTPEYIPGGLPPDSSNAVRRITGETRVSFVGTFDAVARRALASVAFGTASCSNNVIYSTTGSVTRVLDTPYWRRDAILELFPYTLYWRRAADRDYAITNVVVGGRTVPDSVRILNRYFSGLQRLHPGVNDGSGWDPWALTRLVYPCWPGVEPDIRWPEHNEMILNLLPEHPELIGWGFSSATNVATYGGFNAGWIPDVDGLLPGGWWKFFATTWDIFETVPPQIPRRIEEDIWVDEWRYFGYPSRYPSKWENWRSELHSFPTGHGQYRAGIRAVADTIGLINLNIYATNALALMPGTRINRRIEWLPWAKSNGLISLTDTALVGHNFMPQLRYKYSKEFGEVSVDFETDPFFAEVGWKSDGLADGCYYSIFTTGIVVNAASIEGTNSVWSIDFGYEPFRLAKVDWNDSAEFGSMLKVSIAATHDVLPDIDQDKIDEWAAEYYNWTTCPTGTVFSIYTTRPIQGVYDIWGVSPSWGEWPVGFANFQQVAAWWRIASSVSVGAEVETSTSRQIYDYALWCAETNSVPCVYPNPSYDIDDIDYGEKIDATALLCVASSTNRLAIHAVDGAYNWIADDFSFRLMSTKTMSAVGVDEWFADEVDRELEDRVAQGAAGDVRRGHAGLIPKLEEWIADTSGDPNRPVEQRLLNDVTTNEFGIFISMKLPEIMIRIDSVDTSGGGPAVVSATALDYQGNVKHLPVKWGMETSVPTIYSYGECPFMDGATCGSSTGLGAAHWGFRAMKRERNDGQ